MNEERCAERFLAGLYLLIALSLVIHSLSFKSNGLGFTVENLIPKPFYGFMEVPRTSSETPPERVYGADFSQVYFSSQALRHGESAYHPTSPEFRDRFNRLPNYPPFTNQLYRMLCNLGYSQALMLHNFGSLAIFLLVAFLAISRAGLGRLMPHVCATCLLLYFCSPLGLSHYERGQFDLFVAVSYLMLFCSLFEEKGEFLYPVVCGLTGAIKWSSFPFLGTFGMLLAAAGTGGKRGKVLMVFLILLLSIALFIPGVQEYMASLDRYELSARAVGITYMNIMPKALAKSFQLICALTVISVLLLSTEPASRWRALRALSFPFALAMAIQGLCFGTISYEYRVVTFLGLVPAALIWLKRSDGLSHRFRSCFAWFFASFLVIAFRMLDISKLLSSDPDDLVPLMGGDNVERTVIFHTAAMLSLLSCLYIVHIFRKTAPDHAPAKAIENPG